MAPNYIDTFPQGPAGTPQVGATSDIGPGHGTEAVGRTSIDGAGTSASNGLPDAAMQEVFNATAQVARTSSQGSAGYPLEQTGGVGTSSNTENVERMGGAGTTGYNQ